MTAPKIAAPKIAVVIPCYKVQGMVLGVIARIGPEVGAIYVVDDACPERTGDLVEREVRDPRVRVIRHEQNGGVGAATLTGMTAAAADGADVLVKIDGDGQMDPALIPNFVAPIVVGEADYTKGNRFFAPEYLRGMPTARVIGNGLLSFAAKLSSGYWSVFDPANGFLAVHAAVFDLIPKDKLASRFFFESDLLFRLNLVRANVVDIPLRATYAGETSNLRARREAMPFLWYLTRNFCKRVIYSYFVRDFSIGSIYLLCGLPILLFGLIFGLTEWIAHVRSGALASAGTVMVAALPIIVGFQLVLAFFTFDVSNVPRTAIHPRIVGKAGGAS
ncbi:MAG: glycosyltransferase family 2 protein [Alphaproteobacteria bacterium]|nr:glycosyltransferase family 2 protein [Alphaproteobacteria bacterium]